MARNVGESVVSAASKRAAAKLNSDMQRRGFLVALGAGGAAAVAVAFKSVAPVASAITPAATATDSAGYRESDHIRNYYRTAKI